MRWILALMGIMGLFASAGSVGWVTAQDVRTLADGVAQTVPGPVATFTFEGQADSTVFVFAQAQEAPPILTLLAPNGALTGSDNLYETGSAALLLPFSLTMDGAYTLAVNAASTGDMTVLVGTVDARPVTQDPQTFTGQFRSSGDMAAFTLPVSDPRLITYDITCQECAIYTLSPSGEVNYDGYYESPRSDLLQLAESGDYTVLLHNTAPAIDYALRLNRVTPTPLVNNEPVAVTLTETGRSVFAFTAEAGKTWEISSDMPLVTSPELTIWRFENRPIWEARLATDYDSGPNGTPRIRAFSAPEDGTYYVMLRYDPAAADAADAAYNLRLNPASIVRLAPGTALESTITPETGRSEYQYEGQAGQRLRITFERLSTGGVPALVVLSPSDEVLKMDGRHMNRQIADVTLPEDGTYVFTVDNRAYTDEPLTFSLQIDLITE